MQADSMWACDAVDGVPATSVGRRFDGRWAGARWSKLPERGSCDHWRVVCVDRVLD